MSDTPDRLPVTLLTGFLGSGKTTLLSALLRRPDRGRVAVVINEFGEVPIDQALVQRTDGPLVVLGGGCLCCAIGGDIVTTLLDLHQRQAELAFDRVIIETSGLADPGPILVPILQDPALNSLYRFHEVVTVVDVLQGLREIDRQRVSAKQVRLADRIVVTKSDIAAPRALTALRERLAQINPWAALALARHGLVEGGWHQDWAAPPERPPLDLAEIGQHVEDDHEDDDHEEEDHPHDHEGDHPDHHGFFSFCLWFPQPLSWDQLAEAVTAVQAAHENRILRIKGVVDLAGTVAAINAVGGFLHPAAPLPGWPDQDHRSRLVVITDRVPEKEVRPFFAALTADHGAKSTRSEPTTA